MKKILSLFLVLILSLTIAAPGVSYAATTKLKKTKLVVNVGDTYTLKLSGASGSVKWSSSNKLVASVSTKGKVTALSTGNATITANYKKKKYKCSVKVNVPSDSVSITISNLFDLKDEENELGVYLSSIGVKYIVVNEDAFTTIITMTKSQQQQVLSYLKETFNTGIDESIKSGDMPDSFKSIVMNDDGTSFDVYVDKTKYDANKQNDDDISQESGLFALMLISGIYQEFAGVNEDDIKFIIHIYDNDTKELIDTFDSDESLF